jgi:hypothetical protein
MVDSRGQLRGYYSVQEAADLDAIVDDALRLERGG